MRSLFVSTQRRRFRMSASLRKTSVAALVCGVALSSSLALAAEPVVSADEPQTTSVTQSTTTTVTTNAPVQVAPLPPPPTVPQTVIAPVQVAPQPIPQPMPQTVIAPVQVAPQPFAPPPPPVGFAGGYQGPIYFNGPVWIIPAQPGGQAMVQPALPLQLPPPPVFVQPPRFSPPPRVIVPQPLSRPRVTPLIAKQPPRGPVFGIGVRFTSLGVRSQEVFGDKPTLLGGGVQMRFRNQGHWGFELALDALKTNIADGAYVRTSYPFTFSPMLYIFKNRPENHFNIYATAGFGLMASDITLYQDSRQERNQQFWEVLGQAGGGLELRFTRLALFADVRAIGMLLDQGSEPGKFYDGVSSGPIAPQSIGYKANLGAMLWF